MWKPPKGCRAEALQPARQPSTELSQSTRRARERQALAGAARGRDRPPAPRASLCGDEVAGLRAGRPIDPVWRMFTPGLRDLTQARRELTRARGVRSPSDDVREGLRLDPAGA